MSVTFKQSKPDKTIAMKLDIMENNNNTKTSQQAIAELSVLQAKYQLQNEMAIAELAIMLGGK